MVVGREEDGNVYCAAIILLDTQRRLQRKNAIGRGANVGAAPDRIHPDVFEHRVIRGESNYLLLDGHAGQRELAPVQPALERPAFHNVWLRTLDLCLDGGQLLPGASTVNAVRQSEIDACVHGVFGLSANEDVSGDCRSCL